MRSNVENVIRFMRGNDTFIIPVYQRNYAWDTKPHCADLFDGIESVYKQDLKQYFMGATVVVNGNRTKEILLIDGQQRITSISLILFAMYNLLKMDKVKSEVSHLADKILELLVDKYQEQNSWVRLKQINQDAQAYNTLYDLSEPTTKDTYSDTLKDTRIYKNYVYFSKRVEDFHKNYKSIDGLWRALNILEIVKIELELSNNDNPQRVFETINATGKSLDEADLIRNYILMDREYDVQESWYENYWKKIEHNTHKDNKSFTRDAIWFYLMHKNNSYFKAKDTYVEFKKHILKISQSQNNSDEKIEKLESFLQELVAFTEYYKWLNDSCPITPFEKYFKIFRDLKQTTPYSYFMGVLHLHTQGILDENTVCKVLEFILNYYIRRQILSKSTTPYNQLYPQLAKKINYYKDMGMDYLESLYTVFSNFSVTDHYPTDADMHNQLLYTKFYGSKVAHLTLNAICNENTKESICTDGLTIEHIMPQTLTPRWKKDLGENWQQIYDKYVHTIGNLTLTGYNSEYSNKPFADKKVLMQENSNIPLNRYFDTVDTWDEQAIQDHSKWMIDLFNQVFPDIPDRESYKNKDSDEYISIDYIGDITRTKIDSYILSGDKKFPSDTSWRTLLVSVCKDLYQLSPTTESGLFKSSPESLREPRGIADNVYIEVNRSAVDIVNTLKSILSEFDRTGQLLIKLQDADDI